MIKDEFFLRIVGILDYARMQMPDATVRINLEVVSWSLIDLSDGEKPVQGRFYVSIESPTDNRIAKTFKSLCEVEEFVCHVAGKVRDKKEPLLFSQVIKEFGNDSPRDCKGSNGL